MLPAPCLPTFLPLFKERGQVEERRLYIREEAANQALEGSLFQNGFSIREEERMCRAQAHRLRLFEAT